MNTSTFATTPADVARLGTLLGVWAHPDDETYLSGGLLATAVSNGQRVVVVTATAGEAGFADQRVWPPERALVRRAEGAAALAALGVVDQRWLGYPDGGCEAVDQAAAARRLADVVDEVRPDTLLTFGPDGFTGHADHRAVSRWVDAAVRLAEHPVRVLHAVAEDARRRAVAHLDQRLGTVVDPSLPPTLPREALSVHLELRGAVLDRKLVALRAHATQTAPALAVLGEEAYRQWVGVESFVAAPG